VQLSDLIFKMVRTKVFVGNLSFNTKENELAKEFDVAGKVISANIITRGPRSLGYGFVEMENEADAENAVKLLDKKEIDGRPINVEVAKAREEGAEGQAQQGGNAQGQQGVRGGRGGRGRGSRGGSRGGNTGGNGAPRQGQQQQQQQGGENNEQGGLANRRRGSGTRGGSRGGRGGAPGGPKREQSGENQAEDNRTPSTTTLFIANLPFTLTDDTFAKVFKDNTLAFKTAHVVMKKTGRSKGFGFVEFDNEGDQQKALAALNNKEVEGRQLAVKVALTELKSPENASTPAATPTATTSEKKEEQKK